MTRPHDVLGVGPDATPADIRHTYRERVRAIHPDQGAPAGPAAHAAFAELVAASRALMDHPTAQERESEPTRSEPEAAFFESEAGSPEPRLLRPAFVAAAVLLTIWLLVFGVIAFAQSG